MGNKQGGLHASDQIDGSGYTLEGNDNPHRQRSFNEGEYAVLETVYSLADGNAIVVWTVGTKRFVGNTCPEEESRAVVRHYLEVFVNARDKELP